MADDLNEVEDRLSETANRDESKAVMVRTDDLKALLSYTKQCREALGRQADNMAFLLNHAPIVQPWYDKFTEELSEDRQALSTQPGERE